MVVKLCFVVKLCYIVMYIDANMLKMLFVAVARLIRNTVGAFPDFNVER